MNFLFKAYCRIYQGVFRIATNFLNFNQPQSIEGLNILPKFMKDKGLNNILIVTDDVLHNKLNLLDGLKEGLQNEGLTYFIYDKTVPNPTIDNIEEGLTLYKENNCQAIIAFGGGSPMDCAKGIGARVARPNKPIPKMKGVLKVLKKLPPLFAIPTTSGTGSEATLAAVVSNPQTHEKYPINDPVLIPKYVVLDPMLTVKLPKHITSTTGMDALTHAVEAYIGSSNTELTKDMAIKAVKLVFDNLIKAYDDGENILARKNMQYASYFAGVAFTRAYVGNVHAIAHTLGGQYGVPHGLANAVILPHILDFYGVKAHKKLDELAHYAGVRGGAKAFIQSIKDMNSYMNIPTNIDSIVEEDIPLMAERAFAEANPLYPVPVIMSKTDFANMYRQIKG